MSEGDPSHDGPVFVTVGSNDRYPFARLLHGAELLAATEPVSVQYGAGPQPRLERSVSFMHFEDLVANLKSASAVVTHAGIGSVLLALACGKRPVVIPRRRLYGESVDDHQVAFAALLASKGLAHVVTELADLPAAVTAAQADRWQAPDNEQSALARAAEVDSRRRPTRTDEPMATPGIATRAERRVTTPAGAHRWVVPLVTAVRSSSQQGEAFAPCLVHDRARVACRDDPASELRGTMILIVFIILSLFVPWPWNLLVLAGGVIAEVGEVIWGRRLARRWRAKTGVQTMIGSPAEVVAPCRPTGQVRVRGELWAAICEDGADVGDTVRIDAIDELTLTVTSLGRRPPSTSPITKEISVPRDDEPRDLGGSAGLAASRGGGYRRHRTAECIDEERARPAQEGKLPGKHIDLVRQLMAGQARFAQDDRDVPRRIWLIVEEGDHGVGRVRGEALVAVVPKLEEAVRRYVSGLSPRSIREVDGGIGEAVETDLVVMGAERRAVLHEHRIEALELLPAGGAH